MYFGKLLVSGRVIFVSDICDDEDDENVLGLARSQGPETPKVRVSISLP